VKRLTDGVSGAIYKSFKTVEEASAFYLQAKEQGHVRCIRNPRDAARFGPREDAVQ
jgi:viroplasmin and RNaseH domain-containing protein